MSRPVVICILVFISLAVIVVAANAVYWLAEQADDSPTGGGSCAVLVLGAPTLGDGRPSDIQRFRVTAGVQVYRRNECSVIVLSGGAAHNRYIEARTMEMLAEKLGVARGHIATETRSRSTWENIGCSTPLLAGYGRILIVSDALHAFRAKRYACRQNASMCKRVRAVGRMGPASLWWWRVGGALYELRAYLRDKLIYERHPDENSAVCPSV